MSNLIVRGLQEQPIQVPDSEVDPEIRWEKLELGPLLRSFPSPPSIILGEQLYLG